MNEEFERSVAHALQQGDQRMNNITDEVTAVKLEQAEFRVLLKENTDATKEIKADTAELLAVFHSFKAAFKVLEWIGKAAKPMGYIVVLAGSVYGFWSTIKGGGGR